MIMFVTVHIACEYGHAAVVEVLLNLTEHWDLNRFNDNQSKLPIFIHANDVVMMMGAMIIRLRFLVHFIVLINFVILVAVV